MQLQGHGSRSNIVFVAQTLVSASICLGHVHCKLQLQLAASAIAPYITCVHACQTLPVVLCGLRRTVLTRGP